MTRRPIDFDSVEIDPDGKFIKIIDQTQLPQKEVFLFLSEENEIAEAISSLRVRGAPAIGIAAAAGLAVVLNCSGSETIEESTRVLERACEKLEFTRPTAVNLRWALQRMRNKFNSLKGEYANNIEKLHKLMTEEATRIKSEDISMSLSVAENGLTLIKEGAKILTYCNAGHLATGRYGTALAPIYLGIEKGLNLKIYSCETRPLLQGARLTTYELQKGGADVTLICDNMAATLMQQGMIDAVFAGCDRVAANGDTANKIGTLSLAILAKYHSVPFYILGPVSTIDPSAEDGSHIVIEERNGKEITEPFPGIKIAPAEVKTYNPAFDITPAELITAIITDKGIFRYPFHFPF